MAHIIPFPNSAPAPVQQRRGPGRHPKMVVKIWTWRSDKRRAEAAQPPTPKTLQDQLAFERETLSIFEAMVNTCRHKVAVLQQQCKQAE